MQILELLRTRRAERRLTADQTLAAAANRLAADETVDHTAVETALLEAGRSVEDFETMCETARRRRQWRAAFDRGTAAKTRLEKARTTAERERNQFEQIRTQWLERAAQLDAEIAAADAVVRAADDARRELVDPRNVPGAAGDELAAAHAELAAASDAVSALGRQLREQRELEKSQREWADQKRTLNQTTLHGGPEDHERRAERAARRIKELESELREATAAEGAAAARVQKLEAAALKT